MIITCVFLKDFDWSLITAIGSLLVAIATLIVTIRAVVVAKRIANAQDRKQDTNYLLCSIVEPYSSIETDIILLAQGQYDKDFQKNVLDKEVLLSISKVKNYALVTENKRLFDYMDSLITGKCVEADLGGLIDEYFEKREEIKIPNSEARLKRRFYTSKNVEDKGCEIRKLFLRKVREYRGKTVDKITQFLSE